MAKRGLVSIDHSTNKCDGVNEERGKMIGAIRITKAERDDGDASIVYFSDGTSAGM